MKVSIGVGSLASCVRASSPRKRMYVANMPVEIAAKTDIMLVLKVAMENLEAASGKVVLRKDGRREKCQDVGTECWFAR